jgi:hypothetical protein
MSDNQLGKCGLSEVTVSIVKAFPGEGILEPGFPVIGYTK